MAEQKYKRKNFLINRRLQFQIISIFLLSLLLALILFTLGTVFVYWASGMTGENLFKEYITIHRQVTEVVEVETAGGIETREVTSTKEIPGVKRWELVVPALIWNNLLIVAIIIIMGIFSSHRIAGPLYRIQTELAKILDGEKGVRIRLRRKDKLKPLANQLNHLIEEINTLRSKRS